MATSPASFQSPVMADVVDFIESYIVPVMRKAEKAKLTAGVNPLDSIKLLNAGNRMVKASDYVYLAARWYAVRINLANQLVENEGQPLEFGNLRMERLTVQPSGNELLAVADEYFHPQSSWQFIGVAK
ncbi:hypothetical protein [Chitinibacter tainanensis]|uniref:hypothetical protein n=1 Tax=Chitinibacter tainanensis TaxID=230667 RepID=UPI00146FBD4C|nr:hypothetical protein [Chitinibacter tainanensis]